MAVDPQERARLWFELHAQELAAYHQWPIGKARSVIAESINSGGHGFWEHDPVWFWDWKRRYGR